LADLRAGEFLEAAVIHDQQVSGISMRGLRTAANENKIAVNEIEVVGADNIHAAKPDALFLFVVPPSFDEWIARMTARGSLPSDEVTRRMQSAVIEISAALNRDFYQFIVNDTFMQTTKRVDALIAGTLLTNEEQKHGQDVAQALLHDIKTFLTKP
jgi:guanylate kinase